MLNKSTRSTLQNVTPGVQHQWGGETTPQQHTGKNNESHFICCCVFDLNQQALQHFKQEQDENTTQHQPNISFLRVAKLQEDVGSF